MDESAKATTGVASRRQSFAVVAAATLALALAVAVPASASTADNIAPQHPPLYTADDGWQAGTCVKDTPTCSVATKAQFFETAAAHPPVGFTQFIIRHEAPGETPVAELKTVRVDLPVGLSVNPGATDRCPLATFEAGAGGCPSGSAVGKSFVTTAAPILGTPIDPIPGVTEVTVYNVDPETGRAGPLRARTRRQRSLPRSQRRLGRRLPRGLHDQSPESVAARFEGLLIQAADLEKPPGLRRHAPATAPSSPPPAPASARPPAGASGSTLLDLPAGQSPTPRRRTRATASRPIAAPAFESPIPPGTSPKELRHDSLRAGDRRSTLAPPRPTRRPVPTSTSKFPTSSVPATRTAPTPAPPRWRCRSGWASTPRPPTACRPAPTPSSARGPKTRSACPPASKVGTVDDQIAAAAGRRPERQRLRRPAAQPRPRLGRGVPDLRRSRVGSLRGLGAVDRQRPRRPRRPGS